ncbi:MAG: hypothetical protein IJW05_12200 [Lentisphaeria bacterium]|nr:hypothetical protein [Lentisphaeria bacterium]
MENTNREMETAVNALNQQTAGTHIHLHSGATLTYVESECECTIRLIRCMSEKEQISDADFRNFVKIVLDR